MIMFTILAIPLGRTQVSVLLLQLQQPIKLRTLEELLAMINCTQVHVT